MATVWDSRARFYDIFTGFDIRHGPYKRALFRDMAGRVLFLAVGTGLDIRHFPRGCEIVTIDVSAEMLRRASARRRRYEGKLHFVRCDALSLPFPDASFDTVVTSCTMCSVPDPVRALRGLHRVLRQGGRLLMFEHVRSRNWIFAQTLDFMTLLTRRLGPEMNRDTLGNAAAAGFRITRVESVFLDIILSIRAERDEPCEAMAWPACQQMPVRQPQGARAKTWM